MLNVFDSDADETEQDSDMTDTQHSNVRSYHVDELTFPSIQTQQQYQHDIMSMTEDSDYHNHNHNIDSFNMNMDSDLEEAMEENSNYLAQNRHRKPCTDWERYILR